MELLNRVVKAQEVLKPIIRVSDVIKVQNLKDKANVYLKTENLQITGSFKIRGAYFKMSQLSAAEKQCGVVACSAGNHAQGVALASQKANVNATICIPKNAPLSKIERTRSYGAQVELVEGVYDDAYHRALEIAKEEHRTFIHPFDDLDVIAGQGTIALELLQQLPNMDIVVVPLGGGGLLAGIASVIKHLNPKITVIGVEASNAASMSVALKHDKPVSLTSCDTIADGIAVKQVGEHTFKLIKENVDQIVCVSEEEIAKAMLELMENQKLVVEGAGATALAAVLFDKFEYRNKNVVCVVSGGNIDVNILSRVINMGLVKSGRYAKLTLLLNDRPGELFKITEILAKEGANVFSIHHDRVNNDSISNCVLEVVVETKNFEHINSIKSKLEESGFRLV